MSETTEDRAMRSVKPWHFRWPWVTFEGHFGDLLTLVTLCVQLTRNLLAIAKFLVFIIETVTKSGNCMFMTVEESLNPRHKPMGYNPPFCRVMLLSSCGVCVTFVYSVKTNEHIFIHFSLSGSHTILVFSYQTVCRWDRQKWRFWAYIWLHCVTLPARCYQHELHDAARPRSRISCDTYRL